MVSNFVCPVCSASDWRSANSYRFQQEAGPSQSFSGLRRQILFDIWFTGAEGVELTSVYCDACGFMCYSPRPTESDLQAKYRYLSEREEIGALHDRSPRALRLDRRRELFMFHAVGRHHPVASQTVLDVGGGDGRLIRPFLEQGCQCFVVDFNPHPSPGIQRLGSTLDDIPPGALFDVIICSHVLEHVSEPGGFLRRLRSRLSENGVLYVEVPLEIWRGIPISGDPVTHVNFFTVDSLRNALLLNGLKPLSARHEISSYDGRYKRVAWAVASAAETDAAPLPEGGSQMTKALLQPKALDRMLRRFEDLWIKDVLNLPPRVSRRLRSLRMLKRSLT